MRSLTGEAALVNYLITDHKLDMQVLTETLLDFSSTFILTEATLDNFEFLNVFRSDRRGGGVAPLFSNMFSCRQLTFGQYTSIEYLAMTLKCSTPVLLVIVYQPPITTSTFTDESLSQNLLRF